MISNALRSKYALVVFVALTLLWWGWIGPDVHDRWPFVGYNSGLSVVTFLDLIVVGIAQKEQTHRQTKRDEADSEALALLVQLARNDEGILEGLAATLDEVGRLLPVVEKLLALPEIAASVDKVIGKKGVA